MKLFLLCIGGKWLYRGSVQAASANRYPVMAVSVRKGAATVWEHWDGVHPDKIAKSYS